MVTLRLGDRGSMVGDLQQKLVEAGHAIAGDELAEELFGVSTAIAVRVHQTLAGLVVDGIAGPKTLASLNAPGDDRYTEKGWRCRPSDARAAVQPVLKAAIDDIGRREEPDGSNDGPQLAKFRTGGAPWCAYAVSAWYAQADGGSPFGRIGSVWDLRDWLSGKKRLLAPTDDPQPGDLAIVLRARRHGHIALVAHVEGTDVHTIGGNEANAVRARVRQRDAFSVFGRPLPL